MIDVFFFVWGENYYVIQVFPILSLRPSSIALWKMLAAFLTRKEACKIHTSRCLQRKLCFSMCFLSVLSDEIPIWDKYWTFPIFANMVEIVFIGYLSSIVFDLTSENQLLDAFFYDRSRQCLFCPQPISALRVCLIMPSTRSCFTSALTNSDTPIGYGYNLEYTGSPSVRIVAIEFIL